MKKDRNISQSHADFSCPFFFIYENICHASRHANGRIRTKVFDSVGRLR